MTDETQDETVWFEYANTLPDYVAETPEIQAAFTAGRASKLDEHEAAVRHAIAEQIRRHCTPSSEAYKAGGDTLIAEVADWIENTPEWVPSVEVINGL